MSKKRFYNEEEKEYARSVNILSYLQACGEDFIEISNGTYQHVHHDSLRYNAHKNVLNWFSKGEKACFTCIDAAQLVFNYSFTQAMHDILSKSKYISPHAIQHTIYSAPKQFDYERDLTEVETPNRAFNYLTEERHLSPDLIKYCIKKGVIAGDNRGNVVFKWLDINQNGSQKIIGASLRGTREIPLEKRKKPEHKYFKKILAGSDSSFGVFIDIGVPNKLIIAESFIDVLSYVTRKLIEGKREEVINCRIASMEGLKEQVLFRQYHAVTELVKKQDEKVFPKLVTLFDNDQAGQDFEQKIRNYIENTTPDKRLIEEYIHYEQVPAIMLTTGEVIKDQNEYLVYIKGHVQKQMKESNHQRNEGLR